MDMPFDFDPDEIVEEELEAAVEEEIEEMEAEELGEDKEEDEESYLDEVAVGAAIIGVAEEYGRGEAKREAEAKKSMKTKDERPDGAISLRTRIKSKLPKFEQWVRDVISGRKDLDDEL